MDPITLALIVGLGSGVLGGVLSQVVAGVFKTRGDTRQITAGNEIARAAEARWEREQEFERERLADQASAARSARFQDEKREAFVEYMTRLDELTDFLMLISSNPIRGLLATRRARELRQATVRADYRIKLICPSLLPYMEEVTQAIQPGEKGILGWDRDWEAKLIPLGTKLRREMSRQLGIEQSEGEAHNKPQLNEAPVSGDSEKSGPTP